MQEGSSRGRNPTVNCQSEILRELPPYPPSDVLVSFLNHRATGVAKALLHHHWLAANYAMREHLVHMVGHRAGGHRLGASLLRYAVDVLHPSIQR